MTEVFKAKSDEFWEQEGSALFGEDESDDAFSYTSASEDVVDSDFDISEPDSDEEEVEVEKEKKSRKGGYVDPAKSKAPKRKAGASSSAAAASPARRTRRRVDSQPAVRRQSRRTSTVVKTMAAKQRAELAKQRRAARPKRKRPKIEPLTQEQQLEQAKQTEIENAASLAELLHIEELKKKVVEKKARYTGPAAVYISREGGKNYVSFMRPEALPDYFEQEEPEEVEKPTICKITKQPARYFDPKTETAFHNVEAYAKLHSSGGGSGGGGGGRSTRRRSKGRS